MPDGENKKNEAIEILQLGALKNATSGIFFMDAALCLWPLAKHHDPSLYTAVVQWLKKADVLLTDSFRKMKLRMLLGHISKALNNKEEALYWFNKVFEVAPNDEVAKRQITCLETPDNCPPANLHL
jgi:hypothetical protein